MRIFSGLFLPAAIIIITGCPAFPPEDKRPPEEPPPFVLFEELFESETDEDGVTQTIFRTNDAKYWSHEGTTMWAVWGDKAIDFSSRTVKMRKSSGFSGGGYGIVISHGEYEIDNKPVHSMLVIMINNNGEYIIGKAVGGVFTDFGWWQPTPHLNRGAGFTNEITVIYEEETKEYCLIINAHEIERFSDDEFPILRGGRNGYIAVISPSDRFPAFGIDVYYWETR